MREFHLQEAVLRARRHEIRHALVRFHAQLALQPTDQSVAVAVRERVRRAVVEEERTRRTAPRFVDVAGWIPARPSLRATEVRLARKDHLRRAKRLSSGRGAHGGTTGTRRRGRASGSSLGSLRGTFGVVRVVRVLLRVLLRVRLRVLVALIFVGHVLSRGYARGAPLGLGLASLLEHEFVLSLVLEESVALSEKISLARLELLPSRGELADDAGELAATRDVQVAEETVDVVDVGLARFGVAKGARMSLEASLPSSRSSPTTPRRWSASASAGVSDSAPRITRARCSSRRAAAASRRANSSAVASRSALARRMASSGSWWGSAMVAPPRR